MSVHTKKLPIETMHIRYHGKHYAIPLDIAEKYKVFSDDNESVSIDEAFADLNEQFTQAGSLLQGLRFREALTQVEFAKRIKVTQSNLSKMENGKRPIGKEIAKRIMREFSTDYRYFLS